MTAVLKAFLILLKCIGIFLLVVLGLILLTIVLVLLAPIRYRGKLDKKEAPEEIFRADGLISWLNPFLRIRIRYTEKKLHYTVRIFGLCLLNSDKPKKEKKQKKKKQKKSKKTETAKQPSGGSSAGTENVGVTPEPENTVGNVSVNGEPTAEQGGGGDTSIEEKPTAEDVPAPPETSETTEKKRSLFSKIKQIIEKIKAIPEKIKQKVTKIINTIKLLWHKKEKTVAFFEDELHKTALGKTWDTVKQMLRHMLPGKLKGHVEFGTGDPASTGKALGVLGVLYAWYGKGITVVPDFYEKRVVVELEFKGRIRCGTLLGKGIRLIRDKEVKRLIKNFKKLLTILKQKAE